MSSIFTELDQLRTQLKNKEQQIKDLELKLEKYSYYKNKCGHLQDKIRKWKIKGIV